MSLINGLPAHPLLVHFIVVLALLTAALAVLCAVWPAARQRLKRGRAASGAWGRASAGWPCSESVVTILCDCRGAGGGWLARVRGRSRPRLHGAALDSVPRGGMRIAV